MAFFCISFVVRSDKHTKKEVEALHKHLYFSGKSFLLTYIIRVSEKSYLPYLQRTNISTDLYLFSSLPKGC